MTDTINMAPKGYLQGAWDFATALLKDPHKTLDTTANGAVLSTDAPDGKRGFMAPILLAGGGTLLAGAGLFTLNPLAIGAGLGIAFSGAGRFHAIGEAATPEQIQRAGEIVVDELNKRTSKSDGPDIGQP
jgi:hypothetical protein